uniref:Uncharacterized protein n=1 Tax=Oryza brachyantha TaxID=4533 RepID=J3M5Z2_ORYBR
MYHDNIGGTAITPGADSSGFYRTWNNDVPYIFGMAFGVTFKKDNNVSIQYNPSSVSPHATP